MGKIDEKIKILDVIAESSQYSINRAIDSKGNKIIVKTLKEENLGKSAYKQLSNELELLKKVDSKFIIKAKGFTKNKLGYGLILERAEGRNLSVYINENKEINSSALLDKIDIALKILNGLEELNRNNIIHRDLKPSNIIFDNKTKELKIIDFGLATTQKTQSIEIFSDYWIGTPEYLSPEQSGKMNAGIDYRTDFYSFGILLYELFSGQHPFKAKTEREWIHAHLAKEAPLLHEIKREIPIYLSLVVAKLMEKQPDDRYKSVKGIVHDLEICKALIEGIRKPDANWQPGQNDIVRILSFPKKVFGREDELSKIKKSFSLLKNEQPQVLFINGEPGIGKTALLSEISNFKQYQSANVIYGKQNELEKNIPYAALKEGFEMFIRKLLSQDNATINSLKDKILKNLAGNGFLITKIFPDLELIIGKQEVPPELGAQENKNRFEYTIIKFLQTFANYSNPLVLIIDDMQWVDNATLSILQALLQHTDSKYMLFIGTYRSNEVFQGDALSLFLNSINKEDIGFQNIALKGITKDVVGLFLSSIVYRNYKEIEGLSQIIYSKTQGNPFFIKEYITEFYKKGIIYFDVKNAKWDWNFEEIVKFQTENSVAELLSNRVKNLSKKSIEILKIASFLENKFIPEEIVDYSEFSNDEIEKGLLEAENDDLISSILSNKEYKVYTFIHERIQQSVYMLCSDEEKAKYHYLIGKNLYKKQIKDKTLDKNIYLIVNHLNKSKELAREEQDIRLLVELNYKAAIKSRNASALKQAKKYLDNCMLIIQKENKLIWNRDLRLEILLELASVSELLAMYDEMSAAINQGVKLSSTILEKSSFLRIEVQAQIAQYNQLKAVEKALEILDMLGFKFSTKNSMFDVLKGLIKTLFLLRKYDFDKIKKLPILIDREKMMAMEIMGSLISTLYRVDPNLFPIMLFTMIKISVKYGISPVSATGFIAYGVLINGLFGNIKKGVEWGKLGMDIASRFENNQFKAQARYLYYVAHNPWENSYQDSISKLYENYYLALSLGDYEYAVSSAIGVTNLSFTKGEVLSAHFDLVSSLRNYLSNIKQQLATTQLDLLLALNHNLQFGFENTDKLTNKYFDEEKMIRIHKDEKDETSLANIYINKLLINIIYNQKDKAINTMPLAKKYSKGMVGLYLLHEYLVLESVTLSYAYEKTQSNIKKRNYKAKIKRNLKKITKAAENSPSNFKAKQVFLKALLARTNNNYEEATKLFEKSAEIASQDGINYLAALAYEILAEYWSEKQVNTLYSTYLNKSFFYYELWEAKSKTGQMVQQKGNLIANTVNHISKSISGSKGRSSKELENIETLIEAFRIISGEIVQEELLDKTLKILLEHSGANNILLILKDAKKGGLFLSAKGAIQNEEIQIQSINTELTNENSPLGLIQYVERMNTELIISDALNNTLYAGSKYIKQNHSRSVLVIPIKYKALFRGIIYLENTILSNIFNKDIARFINLIATQLAVSIENANIYDNLDEKVKDGTIEVRKQKEIIESKQKDITDSLTYASRIQRALLPLSFNNSGIIDDYFIFYQPRDIVSGDFYWHKKFDKFEVLVTADCTGHGVPGAFMSLLGISLLNELIIENKNYSAAQILDTLRIRIKSTMDLSNSKIGDGIDMALLIFDNENMSLNYAGAYIPLIIVREGTQPIGEAEEKKTLNYKKRALYHISPNTQPVGAYLMEKPFIDKYIQLQEDDTIYVFSDGYADQINLRSKKFTKIRLKKMLLRNSHLDMKNQKKLIKHELKVWKKNQRQVDDLLVIGFKISKKNKE